MRSAMFATLLLGACSAYSPDLGGTPFLCGTEDPTCPDGYACQSGVCVGDGSDAPQIDGSMGSGDCSAFQDDSASEPNDTLGNAIQLDNSVISKPGGAKFAMFAICPKGDKDLFRVDTTVTNQNLTALITYDDGHDPLDVSILNSGGSKISTGSPGGTDMVQTMVANLPTGTVFIQVDGGTASGENSYKMTVTLAN